MYRGCNGRMGHIATSRRTDADVNLSTPVLLEQGFTQEEEGLIGAVRHRPAAQDRGRRKCNCALDVADFRVLVRVNFFRAYARTCKLKVAPVSARGLERTVSSLFAKGGRGTLQHHGGLTQ